MAAGPSPIFSLRRALRYLEDMADPAPSLTPEVLAKSLEHVVLHPWLRDEEVEEQCRVAREYGVASIMVRPFDIDAVVRWTSWSEVRIASIAGFPDGISATGTKLYEGRDLLRRGARDVDFVINAGKLRSRQFQHIELELLQMAESCRESEARLSVIVRNRGLDPDLKIIAAKIARRVNATYLGIHADASELEFFRPFLKDKLKLKASQNVVTLDEAEALLAGGCSLLSTTHTESLISELRKRNSCEVKDGRAGTYRE